MLFIVGTTFDTVLGLAPWFSYLIAKYDFSNSTNREKFNLKDKLIQNEEMDKKYVPLNDNRKSCTIEDSRTHNLIIEHRNDRR
jgi:hypothetical protein